MQQLDIRTTLIRTTMHYYKDVSTKIKFVAVLSNEGPAKKRAGVGIAGTKKDGGLEEVAEMTLTKQWDKKHENWGRRDSSRRRESVI